MNPVTASLLIQPLSQFQYIRETLGNFHNCMTGFIPRRDFNFILFYISGTDNHANRHAD